MAVLQVAGIEIPRKVPRLQRLELAVTATGTLDGAIAVELEPSRITLAGGSVGITGKATLAKKVVSNASTTLALHGLDLRQLAALAGRPAPVDGTLSGTVALTRITEQRQMAFDLSVAARGGVIVHAKGGADGHTATVHAQIVRASDHAELGTLRAQVPIDERGLLPARGWHATLDLARRPFDELIAMLPPEVRAKVPPGGVPPGAIEVHADLAGTPAQPHGTVDAVITAELPDVGPQVVTVHAALAPSATGVSVATTASIGADPLGAAALPGVLATVTGTLALPRLFVGRVLDPARLRAGLVVDETIAIPEHALAALPHVPARVAAIGGAIGAEIRVTGSPPELGVHGGVTWSGYRMADGSEGATELRLDGSPQVMALAIEHAHALAITADVTRTHDASGDHIAIHARAHADPTPLLAIVPALPELAVLAEHAGSDPGRLQWDMDAEVALVRGPAGITVEEPRVTGGLAITGGVFPIPNSGRRWHDIGLRLEGVPHGLRLAQLEIHETDRQVRDRALVVTGLVTLAQLRPQAVELHVSTRDWLALGSRSPIFSDAPIATVDLDAAIRADLSAPAIAVDATVEHLDLRAPDRQDRAHQPEFLSATGDVIFLDDKSGPAGRLPVPVVAVPAPPDAAAPPPPPSASRPPSRAGLAPSGAGPSARRDSIDVKVHIPRSIHAQKAPLDVTAHGELAIAVRGGVPSTRGTITLDGGTLTLFGLVHELVDGHVDFTEAYPHGQLALTFERRLPDPFARDLARPADGGADRARLVLGGDPAKPTVAISGAVNSTLDEVFSMYQAGRPVYVAPPGQPADATVQVPRGDQLLVLTFVSLALPHLMFLDRIHAWADATEPRGAYGRIRNLQADRYTDGERTRVRAVARPTEPGRSTAELQWDHLWRHDDRTVFGGGVRAGDRLGGGLGLFFEWSSAN